MRSNSPRVPLCLRAHAPSRRSRPRSAGAAPAISGTPYHTVYTQHRQPCGLAEFLRARRGRGLRDATWSLASIGAKQRNATQRNATQRNPYLDVADQRNDPRKHLAERAALNSQVSASTDHPTIADHGGVPLAKHSGRPCSVTTRARRSKTRRGSRFALGEERALLVQHVVHIIGDLKANSSHMRRRSLSDSGILQPSACCAEKESTLNHHESHAEVRAINSAELSVRTRQARCGARIEGESGQIRLPAGAAPCAPISACGLAQLGV